MDITLTQAAERLLANDNITILCHRSPDGDTLGSGYALHYALHGLGKRVRLLCADPPSPDMVPFLGQLAATATGEDYVVAVDVADAVLLGDLQEQYERRVDLVIDHHPSNTRYGSETFLMPKASATAQMVALLLEPLGARLTPQIASCLYMGLVTDTGCFCYSNTTGDTLRAAARMLDAGAEASQINKVLFETKKPGRLAVECEVVQKIQYFYEGRCAIMTVPLDTIARHGATDSDLDGLSALPRQIEGVWVGVTIREKEVGSRCRISVRSNQQVAASSICAAFGGGGHMRAAGCTILAGVDEARALLVAEIAKQMPHEVAP